MKLMKLVVLLTVIFCVSTPVMAIPTPTPFPGPNHAAYCPSRLASPICREILLHWC